MSRMTIGLLSQDHQIAEEQDILPSELDNQIENLSREADTASSDVILLENIQQVADSAPSENFTETESQLASAAMEAICTRYGLGLPRSLSMESLSAESRARRILSNQAGHLMSQLATHRAIAMEGFFDNLSLKIKAAVTSEEKISIRYDAAVEELKSSGSKDPSEEITGSFTNYLCRSTDSKLTADLAAKNMAALAEVLMGQESRQVMRELVNLSNDLKKNIRKTWFIASEGDIEKIKKMKSEAVKHYRKSKEISAGHKSRSNVEISATPIQAKDLSKIASARDKLEAEGDFKQLLKDYQSAMSSCSVFMYLNSGLRLGGFATGNPLVGMATAGDLRNGLRAQVMIHHVFKIYSDLFTLRERSLYALNLYIEKSTA